jgi:F0F1-type ATP synthase assembly protein I
MNLPEPQRNKKNQSTINLLLAAVAGQVGCLTLVIIIAAVLGGIALDARFGTKPWFTLGLLLVSVPISLVLMFIIVRATVAKIKQNQTGEPEREAGIGKDT